MIAGNEALRAAFAAGAQWAVNLLEAPGVSSTWTPNITTEAARRYPSPLACPVCGRTDVTVTRAGGMRQHHGDVRQGGWRQVCDGTGSAPTTPKDVTP